MNNLLFRIDVLKEKIERLESLLETIFDGLPFVACKYAWNDIKGKYPFNTCIIIIDGKCYALVHEQFAGQLLFLLKTLNIQQLKCMHHIPVGLTEFGTHPHLITKSRMPGVNIQ